MINKRQLYYLKYSLLVSVCGLLLCISPSYAATEIGPAVLVFSNPLNRTVQRFFHSPVNCHQLMDEQHTFTPINRIQQTINLQLATLCAHLNTSKRETQRYITQLLRATHGNTQLSLKVRTYLLLAQIQIDTQRYASAQQSLQNAYHILNIGHPLPSYLLSIWQLLKAQLAMHQHHNAQALLWLNDAHQSSEQLHHPLILGWVLTTLGHYYQDQQLYEKALTYYDAAKPYSHSSNALSPLLRLQLNSQLSDLYQKENQLLKSIFYQHQAIESAQKLRSQSLCAQQIMRLANLYYLNQQNNQALVNYLNAKELARQTHQLQLIAQINLKMALSYEREKLPQQALLELKKAIPYFRTHHMPRERAQAHLVMGRIHLHQNQLTLAIRHLTLAQSIKTTHGEIAQSAHILLVKIFEQQGNTHRAVITQHFYRQQAKYARKQTNSVDQKNFNIHQQLIELQNKINQLRSQNHRLIFQNNDRRILLIILSAIIPIVILLWIFTRIRLRERIEQQHQLMKQIYYHPRTGWPTLEAYESPLEQLRQLQLYPLHSANYEVPEQIIMVVRLCGEILTMRHHSFEQQKQLDSSFAHHIYHYLGDRYLTGHLGGNTYLFISSTEKQSATESCQELINAINQFIHIRNLHHHVAIGCCLSPFVERSPLAVNDLNLMSIAHQALDCAIIQAQSTQSNQWVMFETITCSPAAFFNADPIETAICDAINKGLIKIVTSGDKEAISDIIRAY